VAIQTFKRTWLEIPIIASLIGGAAGCWATGSAETIRENRNGGLVRYLPGDDGLFGLLSAEDKALDKARTEAEKNCGARGFEVVEKGKVMVGRDTVEIEGDASKRAKGRADAVEDKAEASARVSTIKGREERRLRYVCKDAPTGYEPPPIDLNAINDTAPSRTGNINITSGR
jgi:hypothetical protein